MNIEDKVKQNLLIRGFSNGTLLNNRGLIGATIDETILQVVKNLRIADVSGSLPPYEDCDCPEPFKCLRICHKLIKRCGNDR